MSIAHLQSIFAARTGRDVLPENLPIDVLLSLARELAFLDAGRLDHAEVLQLRACLCDLVERLLGMQPASRLCRFKENVDGMLPGLVTELNYTIRYEIVDRLIENNLGRVALEEAFEAHFLERSAST